MAEIVGQNMVRKSPETLKTRERLSDEEMGNLLSSVGNHEVKAVTLILMRDGTVLDKGNLHSRVLTVQGGYRSWAMSKTVLFGYCSSSFAPIGLVAKEALDFDLSTFGYSITDKGIELGIPLAGLLLDFSEKNNIPLNTLFGSTMSHSQSKIVQGKEGEEIEFRKRAPSTTLKILSTILAAPSLPIREADIEEGVAGAPTGESHLSAHLIRLAKLGLIQYNSIEKNRPFSGYKIADILPEGELPIPERRLILAKSVFAVLKDNPDKYLAINDVLNLLPEDIKKGWSDKRSFLRLDVSVILSLLAKNEYASIEKFHFGKQSEVNTTDEQKAVLKELVEIISRFQNQDQEILEKGRRLAGQIISNPQRVSALLRRAKDASSYANQSSSEETQESILSIVLFNPNGITSKEIQKILEEKYGKRLGRQRVSQLLAPSVKNMSVRVDKKGVSNVYYPKDKAES